MLSLYILSFVTGISCESHSRHISCTVVVEFMHTSFQLSVQIQVRMWLCAHDGSGMFVCGED